VLFGATTEILANAGVEVKCFRRLLQDPNTSGLVNRIAIRNKSLKITLAILLLEEEKSLGSPKRNETTGDAALLVSGVASVACALARPKRALTF
jgi:hypothetical protein